jgi:transcriptional regulator with GAF, ATPase, and Fis domain
MSPAALMAPAVPPPVAAFDEDGVAPVASLDFHAASDAFQAGLIRRALAEAGGNVTAAADRLGLSRHALRHQMGRLGLR